MNFKEEFAAVDLILESKLETRGVDAFALSLIKSERQMRRLFTHLVFQSKAFNTADINALKNTLAKNPKVYFKELEIGFNHISKFSTIDLIGEEYTSLNKDLEKSKKYRNKIFHGQLTDQNLSRDDLLKLVKNIRRWCELLATNSLDKIGYDGFIRNSFQKSKGKIYQDILKYEFSSVVDYKVFINTKMVSNLKKKLNAE
ncbi:MAG: hypothetical protein HOP06_05005 [Methylotenera sp.]|nr:hypothetical protein [Methylotenera sp.]